MSAWSFYHPATGTFTGQVFRGPPDLLDANTPPGLAAMEGEFDPARQRVGEGGVVITDPPPARPPVLVMTREMERAGLQPAPLPTQEPTP